MLPFNMHIFSIAPDLGGRRYGVYECHSSVFVFAG